MTLIFPVELIVDESNFRKLERIEYGYNAIEITNDLGGELDSASLIDYLCAVEGASQIETLTINYSSQLRDLKVMKAFPNLKNIVVYGYKIVSLEGLEWFKKGQYIDICTERNRGRKIADISRAPIERMNLQFARHEDLEAIGECLTLNSLNLFRSTDLDFSKWRRVPLETLALKQGKFKELGNTTQVESLKNLKILGCRNLERLTCDNSRVTWMIIEGCKKLDLRTIQTFQRIEALIVNGSPNEINLTEIGELKHLESLWLLNCNVQVSTTNLLHQFPKLKELRITNLKKEQVLELARLNPDVKISGKGKCKG